MSLKREQYQALQRSRQLLYELLDSKTRPKRVSELRDRVARCLKHFPPLDENGEPLFSKF
jgi:hypothetical protein